jgi:hypothetical protein
MVSASVLPQLTTKYSLVLSLEQSLVSLPQEPASSKLDKLNRSAQHVSFSQAQELICQFFLEELKKNSPESVLEKFKDLFIEPIGIVNSTPCQALKIIIRSGSEETFIYTLKRSIYILVNNWSSARQQKYVQQLIQLLSTSLNIQTLYSFTLKRLTLWRRNFVNSQDYQELKLFAAKYENRYQGHWSHRYSSYLLVSQTADVSKPLEQQEAARTYSKQLKARFKYELAMYTARSSSTTCQPNPSPNPTSLGDEVVRLIQKILKKRSRFSYASLARIFLKQNQDICYKNFKQNILKYLFFSTDNPDLAEILKTHLSSHLDILYKEYDRQTWDNHLLLRTCKRLIEYLTTMNHKNPSLLFVSLISQGKSLTLAILLLKIVLICPQTHSHLECCLAQLIQYYKNQPETECEWLINFLEVIQLTLTIYIEGVQYNLVDMSGGNSNSMATDEKNIYRIFSQIKGATESYRKAA